MGAVVVELLLAGVETGAGVPGVATPDGVLGVGVVAFAGGVALAPPNENPPAVVVDVSGAILFFLSSLP